MKRHLHVLRLSATVLGFSLLPFATSRVVAQSVPGSERSIEGALSGIVRDSSGAGIPSPTILIRHDPSGLERAVSGAVDGTFSIPRVASGRYVLTASARGSDP